MLTLPPELNIRRARDTDLTEMARLHFASFPELGLTPEERVTRFRDNPLLSLENYWICERKGLIIGMFALYDFSIIRMGTVIPAGGIAIVSVAPEARRQRIAYWMMLRSISIMEQNSVPLSILYPFNHAFYHRLGWGAIGRVSVYRFPSGSLPAFAERKNVVPVRTSEEQEAVMKCYRNYALSHNGLLNRSEPTWQEGHFKRVFCYAYLSPDSKEYEGYLTLVYDPLPKETRFIGSDVRVIDFIASTDRALRGLLGFLAAQSDQARAVLLTDQTGVPFDYLMEYPLMESGHHTWQMGAETAWQGVSLMGRIVSIRRALTAASPFGRGSGKITLNIKDDLSPDNTTPLAVEFDNGKINFPKNPIDLNLKCDMSTFSSIYWGALKIEHAVSLGLVEFEGSGDWSFLKTVFNLSKPEFYDYF